ncbi:MAG: hypothetical protein NZM18_01535 [Thermoflexales bacterium]|nr:hypothetical protein [Thermoflexales bacterium]MDW8352861.1 hypothetical protein [Anaerolineae bacterium]
MKLVLNSTPSDALAAALRLLALVAVVAASLPVVSVSMRFFPLVRRAVQIGLLPQHPTATLMHDTCARVRINHMPEFCERVYTLRAPDPALAFDYTARLVRAGWRITHHGSLHSYNSHVRRAVKIECFGLRTWLWGLNESLIVAVYDQRVIFVAGSDDLSYCTRYL